MNSLSGCGATPPLPAQPTAPSATAGASGTGARAAATTGTTGTTAAFAPVAGGGATATANSHAAAPAGPADAAAGAASLGQTNEISSVLARLVDVIKGLVAALQSRVAGAAGGGPGGKVAGASGGGEAPGKAGGCGCGDEGLGGPSKDFAARPTQSALQSQLVGRSSRVGAAGGGPAPSGGAMRSPSQWGTAPGNGVADPVLAQKWFDHIRSSIVSRFGDVNQALAAGYHRNPSSGEHPIHYINDQVFRTADGRDVTMPATLMYERDKSGRQVLVGVMLSSDFNKPMPYFGAGQWHRHPGDPQANMHVFFDKTVAQGAFEMEMGVV